MMEATSTCETSVNFYQTLQRNNPEDSHLCGSNTFLRGGNKKEKEKVEKTKDIKIIVERRETVRSK
jgi:hypothetical protein